MSKLKFYFIVGMCLIWSHTYSQLNFDPLNPTVKLERFTDCAAIFVDGKMLVDDYSPNGQCVLGIQDKGEITIPAVKLNGEGAMAKELLKFRVAIKHVETNTLLMLDDQLYEKIDFEEIKATCQPGDHLIFLLEDDRYILPHHEINLIWGC